MTSKIILDCESFESALSSLAQIFQTSSEQLHALLSVKEIGAHYERQVQNELSFKDYLCAVVEHYLGSPQPIDEVCWFHTSRATSSTTYVEGVLPLTAALPRLEATLVDLVDDHELRERLRQAMHAGGIADSHYVNKTQNSMHWGPYAILVREVAFHTEKLGQHDYLGMPEIIEDICNGFHTITGVSLTEVFSAKLHPTIVKFSVPIDCEEHCINTALCYVYSKIHTGEPCGGSVYCFDGHGVAVPPDAILKVERIEIVPRHHYLGDPVVTANSP